MTIAPINGTVPKQATDHYEVSLVKAAAWGAGGIAVGAGLPALLSRVSHGRVAAVDPRLLAVGVGLGAGAGAIALVRPETKNGALAVGGGAGLATGAVAGALAMRHSGAANWAGLAFGGLIGGMWGGVMGLNAASVVGD